MKSTITFQRFMPHARLSCRSLSSAKESGSSVLIFGSSTGVGKTIVSAGLSIAALRANRKVCYIKPIQTGDMDQYFVKFYTNPQGVSDIHFRTLRLWKAGYNGPADQSIGTDKSIVDDVLKEINTFKSSGQGNQESIENKNKLKEPFTVVETAGGVLSPGPNQTLQADMFKPLHLPVVLVCDSGLGGISGTLCALEALYRRGYVVQALVFIDQPDSVVLKNTSHIQHQLLSGFLDAYTISTSPVESSDAYTSSADTLTTHNNTLTTHTTTDNTVLPAIINLTPLPQNNSQLLGGWFKANESGFGDLFQALQC